MAEFFRKKKKICYMCAGKEIDYKNVDKHQRHIAEQIKRARAIALLPYTK